MNMSLYIRNEDLWDDSILSNDNIMYLRVKNQFSNSSKRFIK